MVEVLQDVQESESNKNNTQTAQPTNELPASDLIATLKSIKIEEQELLKERKELQATETELKGQAIAQIEGKKKIIEGLKSEVVFLQSKCDELEQALGIPITSVYK
jgi:hypothetical protein